MYEELIKDLRKEAEFLDAAEPRHIKIAFAETMKQAANAIEELSRENESLGKSLCECVELVKKLRKPKWIPVTEKLPDVFKHVLVNIPGMAPHPTVQEAIREGGRTWYSNGFRYVAEDISHWMPLPNPPMEEDE